MKLLISENHQKLFESTSIIRDFISLVQDWQSEYSYQGINVKEMVRLFHLLPEKIKKEIVVTNLVGLVSAISTDNLKEVNDILSFTNPDNAKWYQDIRGHDLLIKGTDLKHFDLAISLPKLSNLYSQIGDDEDETIVFGAIIDKSAIDRENAQNEESSKIFHTFLNAGYDVLDDYRQMVTQTYYHDIRMTNSLNDDDKLITAVIINFVKDGLLSDDRMQYMTSPKFIHNFATPKEYQNEVINYLHKKNIKLKEEINYIAQFLQKLPDITLYNNFKTKTFRGIEMFKKKYNLK